MSQLFGITCPNCRRDLKIQAADLHKRLHCRHCEHRFRADPEKDLRPIGSLLANAPAADHRIEVSCPGCQRTLRMGEKYVGQEVECKHCSRMFRVERPGPDNATPASPTPAPAEERATGGGPSSVDDFAAVIQERDRLDGERQTLQRELGELRKALEEASARSLAVKTIRRAYKKARRQWDADRSALHEQQQQELQTLTAETQRIFREERARADAQRTEFQGQLAETQQTAERQRAELLSASEELVRQAESLRRERDAILERLEALEREPRPEPVRALEDDPRFREIQQRHRAEVAELTTALKRSRDELTARGFEHDSRLLEAQERHQTEITQLTETLRQLREEHDRATASDSEGDSAETVAHLKSEVERLLEVIETTRTDHEQAIVSLKECMEAERATWQEQHASIQGEHQRECQILRDDATRLLRDVENQRQKENHAHQRLEALMKVRDNLAVRLEQQQRSSEELTRSHEEERTRLFSQLAEARQRPAEQARRVEELTERLHAVEAELDRRRADDDSARRENQHALVTLQREFDETTRARAAAESQLAGFQGEARQQQDAAAQQNQELSTQAAALRAELDRLRTERDAERETHRQAFDAQRRELEAALSEARVQRDASRGALPAVAVSVEPTPTPALAPGNQVDLDCMDLALNQLSRSEGDAPEPAWENTRAAAAAPQSPRPSQPVGIDSPQKVASATLVRTEIGRLGEEILNAQGEGRVPLTNANTVRIIELSHRLQDSYHPNDVAALNKLGTLVFNQANLNAAEALFKRAEEICRVVVNERDPLLAVCLHNRGMVHQARGDVGSARPLFEQAAVISRGALGPDHSLTSFIMNKLAGLPRDHAFRNSLQNVAWAGAVSAPTVIRNGESG